jgi:membrane associated rhomboid family serine protease
MPLLVTLLPLLGSTFLHNSILELVLIGSTVSIAGVLILKDYFQLHRNLLPVLLLILGVAAKLLGIFVLQHQYEPVIITSGAAFILLSYVANWRLKTIHKATCKC